MVTEPPGPANAGPRSGLDGSGFPSLSSAVTMTSLADRFSDAWIRRAVESAPVRRGTWIDLFLERTTTLRCDWGEDRTARLTEGIREGFAVRSVESSQQHHFAEEGLEEARILAACRQATVEGSPPAAPVPTGEGGADPVRTTLIELLPRLGEELGARFPDGKPPALSLEWRSREIAVAAPGRSVRRVSSTRAILTCRVWIGERELAFGVGGLDLEALLRRSPVDRLTGEIHQCRRAEREGEPAPPGEQVVILAPGTGGVFFHEACGHALEADLVLASGPGWKDRRGEKVAPEFVGAMDDATQPGLEGSYQCDDEGSPARGTVLIARGVLRGFLTDRITGEILGQGTTGNGRRESFRDPPLPRMSNCFLMAGEDDPEQILRDTPSGIYVQRLEGGRMDPATGDFLFQASAGVRIEEGRLTAPLRPFVLSGNGWRALGGIDRVGCDLSFGSGAGACGKEGQVVPVAAGQPTLRLRSLVVLPA